MVFDYLIKSEKSLTIFFLHKIQNSHSIWFPHRFSISWPKVTPKGPVDGIGHPLAVESGWLPAHGTYGPKIFSGWIFMHAPTCWNVFLLCGVNFFSKNQTSVNVGNVLVPKGKILIPVPRSSRRTSSWTIWGSSWRSTRQKWVKTTFRIWRAKIFQLLTLSSRTCEWLAVIKTITL